MALRDCMTYGDGVVGQKGEIVRAGSLRVGDRIVLLDSQSDIGNAIPMTLEICEPRGETQVLLGGTQQTIADFSFLQVRTLRSRNTLVFRVT